jgi:hypothetical protein
LLDECLELSNSVYCFLLLSCDFSLFFLNVHIVLF